jgi:hypothetical protein
MADNDLIPDWDPNTNIGVSVAARVNRRGVLLDTGLDPTAPLALSLSWSSPMTSSSGVVRTSRLDADADVSEVVLSGDVPGLELAKFVAFALTLHLAESIRPEAGSLSPWLVGSILWRESKIYYVEGDAARFPVETLDFSQSSQLPKNAAWYLDWNPNLPADSFLGSVRLYLNTAHQHIQRLTAEQGPDEAELVVLRSILRTDVARQLISGALASEAFLEGEEFEPGSVGSHIVSLIGQVFPERPIEQLAAEMRERPNHFEARMQSRLRFLQG